MAVIFCSIALFLLWTMTSPEEFEREFRRIKADGREGSA
jgi:hypothetical protein